MTFRSVRFLTATFIAGCIATNACAQTVDSITLEQGQRIRGEITAVSPTRIEITNSGNKQDIDVSSIAQVRFGDEPTDLVTAKKEYRDGRYDKALQDLQNVNTSNLRDLLAQEVAFYSAAANAQMALSGSAVTPADAQQQIAAFISGHANSFNLFPSISLNGRLMMLMGQYAEAEAEFDKLIASNFAAFQLDGFQQRGIAQLRQKKYDAAEESFAKVLEVSDSAPQIAQEKLIAQCLHAKAMAHLDRVDEARQSVESIIKSENDQNRLLFAHAYNALGNCSRQAGDLKKAERDYLHTHLLYSVDADTHAEALYHLHQVWTQLNKPDRASQAREMVKSRYPNSYWAQQL